MIDMKELGKNLRQIRENKGMSAKRVARECSLHINTVYFIEEGKHDLKLKRHIIPMCKCYGITVQLLIASVERQDKESKWTSPANSSS